MLVEFGARLDADLGFRVEVLDVDPAFSPGDLKAKAEAIRRRLREAGVWDANRALSRPPDFRRIAVVSPPGAAGSGDFRSMAEVLARTGRVSSPPSKPRSRPARRPSQPPSRLRPSGRIAAR